MTAERRNQPGPIESAEIWTDEHSVQLASQGEGSGIGHLLRRFLHRSPKPKTIPEQIMDGRRRINATAFASAYRKDTGFEERDADLVVTSDPVGLTRNVKGKLETYMDKLEQERAKGVNESGSYGTGNWGGRRFASFISNWEFMGASSGRVYGEKIVRTMRLAIKEKLPVLIEYSSGGQRQQEAASALKEMDRTGHYIRKFKRLVQQPIISLLVGNVWGGVSASDVTEADFVAGMAGSNFGFAGPGVIEGYTKQRPADGVQTVEYSSLTNRAVHVVLNSLDEAREFASGVFASTDKRQSIDSARKVKKEARGLDFSRLGFHTPLESTVNRDLGSRSDVALPADPISPDSVYNQHLILRSDPRRPDAEYIMQNSFDGFVPLYSHWTIKREDGIYQRSPGIIASLAYIDDPRLQQRLWMMVIGNQPSYLQLDDGSVMKNPASPTAADYKHQRDMMRAAERLVPLTVSLTDTLGAKPTTEEEEAGQFREISDCLADKDTHSNLEFAFVLGAVGSGGGDATTLDRDYVAMLDDSQIFVAEPESATKIIVENSTREDVERTAEGMKPTAAFLKERGIIDGIIDTEGGAQNNPFGVAMKIRERIITKYLELGGLYKEELMERGEGRLDAMQPIPIGYLNPRPEDPHDQGTFAAARRLFEKYVLRRKTA